jgi:outer membrane receptor protein involved in Fe transport
LANHLVRTAVRATLAVALATTAPPAWAATVGSVNVRAGDLAVALADLARQTRMELFFDRDLLRGRSAPSVRGRLSGETALSRLLAGSGLGWRKTPDGVVVIFALPPPAPSKIDPGDGAVAELLVVGRRTQNADIRRTENDIQPYKVLGSDALATTARGTLDEALRVGEPANTQAGPLALGGGDVRSRIDLRGFGEASTLVLVDGRRMPFVPSPIGDFSQPDVNAIPPGAVDRIEVLASTAGGIFGPGAIGGVVNIVLRRDYRGLSLTAQGGVSDRGDATQSRLEGRLGFTPDDGRTDIMFFVSHGRAGPLETGRRGYVEDAARLRFDNNPAAYAVSLPIRNGVSVASLGGDLVLKTAQGPRALGSAFTFLPLGFEGAPAQAEAALAANAGKLPADISDDLSGKRRYIATAPSATSGLLNVRRRLGSRAELFADGVFLRDAGRWAGARSDGTFLLSSNAPGNPFAQPIALSFPIGVVNDQTAYTIETSRWTLGAFVDLPGGWKTAIDYTAGRTLYRRDAASIGAGLLTAVSTGRPGPGGEPPIAPFGSWAAVVAALPAYSTPSEQRLRLDGRLLDASLRLSGPLTVLPGGPLTTTLLVEARRERVADAETVLFGQTVPLPWRVEKVGSAYLELRAPLGSLEAASPLVRGLEAQLAVRHERTVQEGAAQILPSGANASRFSKRQDTTMFTLGARVAPTRGLLLRASLATGGRPPMLADFQGATLSRPAGSAAVPDPRRPGRTLGGEGSWELLTGGSTRVGPAKATSLSVGFVVNPETPGAPRLSVDYTRILASHEPVRLLLDPAGLLAAEHRYPGRVIRAPLTDADRAAGYTVGRITALDMTLINSGRTKVEAVDAKLDWPLPAWREVETRLYGAATWEPRFSTGGSPGGVVYDKVGFADGPLRWRGNIGAVWRRGPVSVDLNVQYYAHYRVSLADTSTVWIAQNILDQGRDRVAAQAYADLSLRRRFSASSKAFGSPVLDASLSIQNIFDKSPPIMASLPDLGFSPYGDPRRRRIVASLSTRF